MVEQLGERKTKEETCNSWCNPKLPKHLSTMTTPHKSHESSQTPLHELPPHPIPKRAIPSNKKTPASSSYITHTHTSPRHHEPPASAPAPS